MRQGPDNYFTYYEGQIELPPIFVNTPENQPQAPTTGKAELPPIIVNAPNNQQMPAPAVNSVKQEQLDLLKSELEIKITQEYAFNREISAKNQHIKQLENQITVLKARPQEPPSINQSAAFAGLQAQITGLRNRVRAQDLDLKARNDSIHWLNQVVAVVKNKSEYFKLTSQKDRLSMKEVQQVRNIKDDFALRFKDDDQFESAIVSLKGQVSRLGMQLSLKADPGGHC